MCSHHGFQSSWHPEKKGCILSVLSTLMFHNIKTEKRPGKAASLRMPQAELRAGFEKLHKGRRASPTSPAGRRAPVGGQFSGEQGAPLQGHIPTLERMRLNYQICN